MHREFDELGVHLYAEGTFRVRHRTVNRLLSKVRQEIRRDRKTKSPIARYRRATRTINLMLGYKVSFQKPGAKPLSHGGKMPKPRPRYVGVSRRVRVRTVNTGADVVFVARRTQPVTGNCWINGVRYVQPRRHALLGHSDLTMAQMHRVDCTIQRWMSREFRAAIRAPGVPRALQRLLRLRRIRSAAKMFEMAAREPVPKCPGGAF